PEKREETGRMRGRTAEPQDVRHSLTIAVAVRDDVLVGVVDDRQGGHLLRLGQRSYGSLRHVWSLDTRRSALSQPSGSRRFSFDPLPHRWLATPAAFGGRQANDPRFISIYPPISKHESRRSLPGR